MFSSALKKDTRKTIDEVAETKKIHEKEIETLSKKHEADLKKHEQKMSNLLKRQEDGTMNLLNNSGDLEKMKELRTFYENAIVNLWKRHEAELKSQATEMIILLTKQAREINSILNISDGVDLIESKKLKRRGDEKAVHGVSKKQKTGTGNTSTNRIKVVVPDGVNSCGTSHFSSP